MIPQESPIKSVRPSSLHQAERYRSYLDAVITGTDLDKLTDIAQKFMGLPHSMSPALA